MLRDDIVSIVLGVVITFIGLAALTLAGFRWKLNGPLLFAFGLFSGLYGIRLLGRTETMYLLFDARAHFWEFFQAIIRNLIIIPGVVFMQEVGGPAVKASSRWWLWFFSLYGALAVAADLVTQTPFKAPDPANFLFLLAAGTLVWARLAGRLKRNPLDRPETRALTLGSGVFALSVINEHLVEARLLPWHARLESVGFFIFLCALGYVAARRFFVNQQQLLAIEQEMAAARRIQSSILPRQSPQMDGLRIAVRYVPMAAVAGDFYDFLPVDERRLGILVADTVGHGVPAALVASMIKIAFASQGSSASDPATLLSEMNRIFCRQAEGQFITAGYLFLDLEKRTALYAGAGHPPLLVWRKAEAAVREIQQNGLLLGFQPTAAYSNVSLDLGRGDRILLYTDGILEATNARGEFFGEDRFKQLIASNVHVTPESFADGLLRELSTWTGTNAGKAAEDDLTLVVISVES